MKKFSTRTVASDAIARAKSLQTAIDVMHMRDNDRTIKNPNTIKATLKAIRELSMSASHRDGEWRVTFPASEMRNAERREAVAHYTNDASDARHTAKRMREHQNAEYHQARIDALCTCTPEVECDYHKNRLYGIQS